MKYRFVAVGLLLLQAWLLLSTLSLTTPTVDEPVHIVRGYAFAERGNDRLRLRGPVLPNLLSGLTLRLQPNLQLPPEEDAVWNDTEGGDLSRQFMWHNAATPQQIIFWGRLPIILSSLLLSAFVFRWARERTSPLPALGAMTLSVFCPNLLAHGRLATTDLVTAATFFVSAHAFDHALRVPRKSTRLFSGVALGLALASKFSSFVLPIALVIMAAIDIWLKRRNRRATTTIVVTLLATFIGGAVTLWAIYGFKAAPLRPGEFSLPAPSYWGEWEALIEYLKGEALPGYLFGGISPRGWWYYYPVAFAVKSPLPVLIFAVLALGSVRFTRRWRAAVALWLAPGLLFGSLLFSPHDIGYRYLLPVLPFIYVGSADVISAALRTRWMRAARLGIGALIAWQIAGTLLIYPYYLAYFNELSGGPLHGRYILSDSNIDWGQDLIGLKRYVDEHGITNLKMVYFGSAPVSAYGLRVEPLPLVLNNMLDQGPYWLHTYYPPDPPPGKYAISVVNLMSGTWFDPNAYRYFRDRQPDATIGYSIYVFTVPAYGAPADLALSGVQVDQIDPATHARFDTNDVRPRWFDAASSLIAAPGETWIAIADDQPIAPELQPLFESVEPILRAKLIGEDRGYALYHFDLAQRITQAAQQARPASAQFGDTAELLGYNVTRHDRDLTLTTYWRAGANVVTPVQLFAHVLVPDGSIVAQQDRLDVPAYGWHRGDVLAQVQHVDLPPNVDESAIAVGLYNPDSGQRLPVSVNGEAQGDRLLLNLGTPKDQ